MKAYRFVGFPDPPVLVDVPVPDPGPDQVLVRIGGAGACHSDLHLIDEEGAAPWAVPFTLGHENAGTVAALGAGVEGVDVGAAVAVYGAWGCGRCKRCRLGEETRCDAARAIGTLGGGLGRDGGMAEYLLVPSARHLVPIGDLDPVEAAPLTDAALTPYHAVRGALHVLAPDATAVVIGVGGLGHMAVQILRAVTAAQIVAVDVSAEKRAHALRLGADVALPPEGAAERVRELTGGVGADAVLDLVGAQATVDLAASLPRAGVHVAVVGLGGGTLPVRLGGLPMDVTAVMPYWGARDELVEALALAQAGRIRADVERFPLAQADEAYRRMREGTLAGRAVLVP